MIRVITGLLAGLALLLMVAGTASAQETTPSPSPTESLPPVVSSAPPTSSSTDVTLPPSSTVATPTSSAISSPTTATVTAVVPAAIPPVRTTSRSSAARSSASPVDAAAELAPVHSAQPAAVASSTDYSELVPWIAANEHPEILVLALVLLFGSSTWAIVLAERRWRVRR